MRFFNRNAKQIFKEPISMDCVMACLYFMCLPFTVVTTPFGSLLKVVTVPIILVLLLRMLMGKNDISLNYVHFFYVIYIVYTISMLFVYDEGSSVVVTKDMVLGMLMFILISSRVYNDSERELMETSWLVVGIICIYACLTSTEVVSQSESRAVVRILGFEEDQNQFCAYLIMPTLVCVKRFLKKGKLAPVYVTLIALSFYSILKTGSRGGLLGVMLGLAAYAMIGIKSIKTKIVLLLSALLLVFVFMQIVVPMLPQDVAERYSVSAVEEDGGSGRIEIWEFLINYSFSDPVRLIRGSGLISTYDIMHSAGFRNGVAHNAFVQILNDEGMVGLLLFLICDIMCVFRNIKRQPLYSCAFVAMMGFAISLSFYSFKPYLNLMMMCAMTFESYLPKNGFNEDTKLLDKGENADA